MSKKWYVLHTQTGLEERVKIALEKKMVKGECLDGIISEIMIPTEKISEIKEGKKKISQRKFFPGYVLVYMEMTDSSWHLVKNIPGVSKFIGSLNKPVSIAEDEIKGIIKQTEEKKEKPSPKVIFTSGEAVKVIEGPFTNFNGTIEEVNPDRGKLKVSVSIFGRSTPLELEYWQVEKV